MRIIENCKKQALLTVCAALIITASGCGNTPAVTEGTTAPDTAVSTTVSEAPRREFSENAKALADEYFGADEDSLTAWKDTDRNKIIASVNDPEHIPFLDITFGDFFREYMFYLATAGITDDMSEANADTCKSKRVDAINYMAYEKATVYTAEKELGISESTLTAEQLSKIRSDADQVRSDWASTFEASAKAKLGESASQEDIDKLCSETLDVVLDKCGINYDIFYQWELQGTIQDLAVEAYTKDATYSEDDVNAEIENLIAEAKDAYENDPEKYEGTPSYNMLYVPEGVRKARHILLHYSEEGSEKIIEAFQAGDEQEAIRLAQEELDNGLKAEADEIVEKLENGADFDEILIEKGGEGEHLVIRESSNYGKKYINTVYGLENVDDIGNIIVSPAGVYIIQYRGEAKATDTDRELIAEQVRGYLESQAKSDAKMNAINKLIESYNYVIDSETLKIDASDLIKFGALKEQSAEQ